MRPPIMFEPAMKTFKVTASIDDSKETWGTDRDISVTVKVPADFPVEDLKSCLEDAVNWCKAMAEKLSATLWSKG